MTAPRDEAVLSAMEIAEIESAVVPRVVAFSADRTEITISFFPFAMRVAGRAAAKARAAAFAEAGRVVEGLPAFDYTSEGMERAVPQHYGDYIDRDDALTALAALRDAAQQGGNDGTQDKA